MPRQRNPNGIGTYTKLKDGRVRWRQKVDGDERTLYAKTMAELTEQVKLVADLPIIKTKYKVEEWFVKWLSVYIKPLKKQSTYDQYNQMWTLYIKPEIGSRKIKDIKSVDIQSVIAKMNEKVVQAEVKDEDGKIVKPAKIGLSTWTMKHCRKTMNLAFKKAFTEKIIPINPCVAIEVPKKQAKTRKTLSTEEIAKLFKALENSRWIWSAKFMLVTGLRRGELLALKWSDIDIKNKRMIVDESNSVGGLGDTKSAKVHYVPLSKKAIEYLDGQKKMLESEFNPILHNDDLKKTELVFPNELGVMLQPGSYYTLFARAANKAGIYASPHCLRHTFVYMNRQTLSLKELQAILGHDESTTTLDIYGDIINESTDSVAAKIDNVFAEIDKEVEKEKPKEKAKVINMFDRKAK